MRHFPVVFGLCLVLGCVDDPPTSIGQSGSPDSLRPFAIRAGTTITLHPSGASFSVPAEWVEWHNELGNNFHLTHEQIDAVTHGGGVEWDTEYAKVCNAVFPIDRCCAHLGDDGWGRDAVAYNDIQLRVYELKSSLRAVEATIDRKGTAEVERITGEPVDLKKAANGGWQRALFTFDRSYGDYGGTAHVDIRFRRFHDRTFAFVFMYTEAQPQLKWILDSFRRSDIEPGSEQRTAALFGCAESLCR